MTPPVNPADLQRSLPDWLMAAAVAVAVLFVLLVARRLLTKHFAKAAARAQAAAVTNAAHALFSTTWFLFLLVLAVYVGALVLHVGPTAQAWVEKILTITVFAQAARWAVAILDRLLLARRGAQAADGSGAPLSAAAFLGQLVIIVVFALLALDNLGVNVSALIAGLGVTSIAVALALQNILADLFASLSIHFDKPFEIGDSITVDDMQGNVEHVGLRTTRLRSVSGEQLVIGNRDLLASRIRNYKRMGDRRAVLTFGLTAGAPVALVAQVPQIIEETVTAQEHARFDRAHLTSLASGVLNYETVYYMKEPDYGLFMSTRQAVYLTLYQRFTELGLEFAPPTQRLLVKGERVDDAAASRQ